MPNFNIAKRTLTFTFNEYIDVSTINLSGISITNGTETGNGTVILDGVTLPYVDSATVTLTLTPTMVQLIKTLNSTDATVLQVTISDTAMADLSGNNFVGLANTELTIISDDVVPLLVDDIPLTLNLDTSTLTLTFNETIDVSATTPAGITVTDSTGANGVMLIGAGLPDPDTDSDTLVITLTESQRLDIIALYVGANVPLKLDVTDTAIADIGGNNFAGLTGAQLQVIATDVLVPSVTSVTTNDITSLDLVFSENITVDSPSLDDFTINWLPGTPIISSAGIISENSLRLHITGSVISDTDLTITLSYARTDGAIHDPIGNNLANFSDFPINNTLDTTRPIPIITLNPSDTFTPTGLELIPITITFSEPVIGFEQSDMLIVNGVLSSLSEEAPNDGTMYRGVVTPSSTSGIVSVTVPANVAMDVDGPNGNIAAILDVPADRIAPTLLSAQTLSATTVALYLSEPVTLADVAPASFTISGTDTLLPSAMVTGVELLSGTINAVVKLTLGTAVPIAGSDAPTVSYTASTGTVSDASGNTLSDFTNVPITNNVSNPPAVTSVYAISPNGTYLTGEIVEIAVLFTNPVTVTTGTGGNPSLQLETGTRDGTAVYTGIINNNSVLKFTYTVAAGDLSNDLQYLNTAALILPLNTTVTEFGIPDTVNASTTLPTLSSANSLASNSDIVIAGNPTQVIRAEMRGAHSVEVSYDRPVIVQTAHYTNLAIGGTVRNVQQVSGSGTANILISFDGLPTVLGAGGTVDINTHAAKIDQIISTRSESGTFIDRDPVTLIANDTSILTITDEITTRSLVPVLGLHPLGAGSILAMPLSTITITFDYNTDGTNDVHATFAPGTTVSNLGPKQIITMSVSEKTVTSDMIPTGAQLDDNTIIDMGDPARDQQFDNPVIIDLVGRAGDIGFFIDAAGSTHIVPACNTDHVDAAAGNTIAEIVSAEIELRIGGITECSADVGNNLRIYSLHFSSWGGFTAGVTVGDDDDDGDTDTVSTRNRNNGGGGGGGGASGTGGGRGVSTPPSFTTLFTTGTETITINNVGIAPKPFNLLYVQDEPVTILTDLPVPFSFTLYDDESWQSITHLELCINKSTPHSTFCDADTKIIWNKNDRSGIPEIIDPNSVINTASITVTKNNPHVATFDLEITFDGAINTTDLQIRAWDAKYNTLEFTVENALVVTDQNGYEHKDGVQPVSDENTSTTPASNDQNNHRRLIISMWAGYHADHATDTQLFNAFDIEHATTLPNWLKSDLGTWVAQDLVSLQEFDAALQYLTDNQNGS